MSAPRAREMEIGGWGNYPVERCRVYRPETLTALRQTVEEAPEASLIARGHGRSYGDASLNAGRGVVLGERLGRILGFDESAGIVHCEAAVGLWEIIEVFLPRGFFFPVTPGTKHISIGGAIAADVHGKNHHRDGSIGRWLERFRLLTASGAILDCSRHENADVFWASVGGMGLTGVIVDAHLRLKRVETAFVLGHTEKAPHLDAALESMAQNDRDADYSVAWIDCLARGRKMGRSVILRANPAPLDALPPPLRATPLAIRPRSRINVPFHLPDFVLNDFTMGAFNTTFYHAHRNGHAISNMEPYFYVLDSVLNWNRVYGKRGVLQYQVVVPTTSARPALVELLERITEAGGGSFLAVLKSMGEEGEGLLSFPMPGFTLSLDFAYTGPDLIALLHRLDEIVLRHGGRVYLAKDACLEAELFRQMYPGLARFQEIKQKVDPDGRFASSLARRVGLVETP